MHSEIGAEHTVVPWTLGILDDAGVPLRRDHRVLDFRCETGLRVYEFRAYGFCAMGFDTHNRVTVREEADKDWFIFSDDACRYHIPQPDNTFDFVFSGGLEHVRDYDAAFQEIHRVLKPGGTSLQVCPARWRPIERFHLAGGFTVIRICYFGRPLEFAMEDRRASRTVRSHTRTGDMRKLNCATIQLGRFYCTRGAILNG